MARVELIYDRDCPNIGEARAELLRAFERAGASPRWEEWERSAAESPSYVRQFGSPTVLVDGKDVAPMEEVAGEGCCRLYGEDSGTLRAPSAEQIAVKLRAVTEPVRKNIGWGSGAVVLPGAGVALLPKLACPACWPAYAAVVSSLGLGFLLQNSYLLVITTGFLLLALGALWWRAKERRGYGPLVLGVMASAVILLGKFKLESQPIWWAGAALLVAACAWNGWPRRGCPACAVPEQI
ncbi:MAG TPA: MerC family mercury resistance protein [Terriglobales bacterium]|nr:MerC family mercury resistance protein [Terriglobales bacterium]